MKRHPLTKDIQIPLIILCVFLFLFFETHLAHGQQFTPLTGIPEVAGAEGTGITKYLNQLFLLTIVLGALIAVIKIAVAGFKYAMSDIITDKSSAKSDIQWSLTGLLILLGTYVFLYTINPNLVDLNIFQNLKFIQTSAVSVPTGGGVTLTAGEKLASTNKEQATSDVTSCVAKSGTPSTYVNEQNATVFCCWQKSGDCSSTKFKTMEQLGVKESGTYTLKEWEDLSAQLGNKVGSGFSNGGSSESCAAKGYAWVPVTIADCSASVPLSQCKNTTSTGFCNQTYQVMSQAMIDAEIKKEADAKAQKEKLDAANKARQEKLDAANKARQGIQSPQ